VNLSEELIRPRTLRGTRSKPDDVSTGCA